MENYDIEKLRVRTPLMRPEWVGTLRRMREHPHAPAWNTEVGDRLFIEDFDALREFERALQSGEQDNALVPGPRVLDFMARTARVSDYFQSALANLDAARDFDRVPLMGRDVLQKRLSALIPRDADLSRLIVNPTSGTTGEPVRVPTHPYSQGAYDPLITRALSWHGIIPAQGAGQVTAIQLCFQERTIVYNTVHSWHSGAGFAKVNINPAAWNTESAALYIADMAPSFISGDPTAFAEALARKLPLGARAILSTSLELTPALRQGLEEAAGCPVVDFYSANDTGPIAAGLPGKNGYFAVLPHDIFVEAVGPDGKSVGTGVTGEICVTGGRNPYVPLLRYRTGDLGSIHFIKDSTGMPRKCIKLEGTRREVLFRRTDGSLLNTADIGRLMVSYPVYRFTCAQEADGSVTLRVAASILEAFAESLRADVERLLGKGARVTVTGDPIPPAAGKNPFSVQS